MVWLGKTNFSSDKLVIPAVSPNNQTMTPTIGGANNNKLVPYEVGFVLVSDNMCAKALSLKAKMALHTLTFGGETASRDQKHIVSEGLLNDLHETFWVNIFI